MKYPMILGYSQKVYLLRYVVKGTNIMGKLFNKACEYYDFALKTMKDIGAIAACEVHSDYFYWTYKFDKNDVFAILTNKLKEEQGDIQDFKLFQKQIDIIFTDAAYETTCPFCHKE